MKLEDFQKYGIKHFSPIEIESTGAKLDDVDPNTIVAIDKFRTLTGAPVHLLAGGITTGGHKSEWHPKGMAIDFVVTGTMPTNAVLYAMLAAGFRGCGAYYNGTVYSYHGDLRPSYAFWAAWKRPGEPNWKYEPLIIDPRSYLK